MAFLPVTILSLSYVHAVIAVLCCLTVVYLLMQKIAFKRYFLLAFVSLFFLSFSAFTRSVEAIDPGFEGKLIPFALLLMSFVLFSLFHMRKKDALAMGFVVASLLVPERFLAFAVLPVFYAPFVFAAGVFLRSQNRQKVCTLPYWNILFSLGLFLPLVYWKSFSPRFGFLSLLPVIVSSLMFFFFYLSIFALNNISKKQFLKYALSLVPVYLVCLYFSHVYSIYYSFAAGKQAYQKEIALMWTYFSFSTIVISYLFYGVFSKWLVRHFIKGYEKKEEALSDLALEINPFYKLQDIFLSFMDRFESLIGVKLKAAAVFSREDTLTLFSGEKQSEIRTGVRLLKDLIMDATVLPSEFFFRNTFHLLLTLKKMGITEDFGYIIPIHVKGEFDGFFITEPLTLKEKLSMSRLLHFLEHFKATVEKVMLNARQLRHEKDIQDKVIILQEKKRTAEEFKKKNLELQEMLEKLKNKQSQLITAEKWASICQVTVSLNHEINNPLTHIMGSSQILKMQLEKGSTMNNAELYKYLSRVEEQCQRIKEIIENLRKISEPVAVSYMSNVKMLKLTK